jgi:multicomponent Na+:H+ antiporter subunit F
MTAVTTIALGGLAVAAALCMVRLLRSDTIADRIVALDALLVVAGAGVAVGAARTGDGTYLDVLVVASLLGFVGTVTVARFIERRGT